MTLGLPSIVSTQIPYFGSYILLHIKENHHITFFQNSLQSIKGSIFNRILLQKLFWALNIDSDEFSCNISHFSAWIWPHILGLYYGRSFDCITHLTNCLCTKWMLWPLFPIPAEAMVITIVSHNYQVNDNLYLDYQENLIACDGLWQAHYTYRQIHA